MLQYQDWSRSIADVLPERRLSGKLSGRRRLGPDLRLLKLPAPNLTFAPMNCPSERWRRSRHLEHLRPASCRRLRRPGSSHLVLAPTNERTPALPCKPTWANQAPVNRTADRRDQDIMQYLAMRGSVTGPRPMLTHPMALTCHSSRCTPVPLPVPLH